MYENVDIIRGSFVLHNLSSTTTMRHLYDSGSKMLIITEFYIWNLETYVTVNMLLYCSLLALRHLSPKTSYESKLVIHADVE